MTINQLRYRARKHGVLIRKYERGEDSFILVDARTNLVHWPYPLTIEGVAEMLDDLDSDAEPDDEQPTDN